MNRCVCVVEGRLWFWAGGDQAWLWGDKKEEGLWDSHLFLHHYLKTVMPITRVTQTCDPSTGKGNFRALKMLCVGEKQIKTDSGQPNFNSCFPSHPLKSQGR